MEQRVAFDVDRDAMRVRTLSRRPISASVKLRRHRTVAFTRAPMPISAPKGIRWPMWAMSLLPRMPSTLTCR